MLGTYVEIRVDDDLPLAVIDKAIDAAFDAVALCSQLMSFHDSASELSRINRALAAEVLSVHPWTARLLGMALEMFAVTGGVFDAGVGAQLVAWGLLPAPIGTASAAYASLSDIECLPGHRIRVLRPTCLDLGGIAKGYAVDRATEVLREQGISQALVNAGGDLRVLGDAAEDIHVRHPAAPATLIHLGQLSDGALASSAPYFSQQVSATDATQVCALVDALTRKPLLATRSYTVIAPECWVADALTKALAGGLPPESECFSRYDARPIIV